MVLKFVYCLEFFSSSYWRFFCTAFRQWYILNRCPVTWRGPFSGRPAKIYSTMMCSEWRGRKTHVFSSLVLLASNGISFYFNQLQWDWGHWIEDSLSPKSELFFISIDVVNVIIIIIFIIIVIGIVKIVIIIVIMMMTPRMMIICYVMCRDGNSVYLVHPSHTETWCCSLQLCPVGETVPLELSVVRETETKTCIRYILFLLLLCSQLDLWGSPFWVTFVHMWPFFVVVFFIRP